jgi:hypothetical protein
MIPCEIFAIGLAVERSSHGGNLRSIAFLILDEEQIALVVSCANVAPGGCFLKFFVVLSGQIEILTFQAAFVPVPSSVVASAAGEG